MPVAIQESCVVRIQLQTLELAVMVSESEPPAPGKLRLGGFTLNVHEAGF